MSEVKEWAANFRTSSPPLLVSIVVTLLAGVMLGAMAGVLDAIPGLILIVPAAIGLSGAVFGAFGGRVGTSMHLGTYIPAYRREGPLRTNVNSSIVLMVVFSLILGILADLASNMLSLESPGLFVFLSVTLISGIISSFILILIGLAMARFAFRKGLNLDDFFSPVITASGDIVTIVLVFLMGSALLALPDGSAPFLFIIAAAGAAPLLVLTTHRGGDDLRRIISESAPALLLSLVLFLGAGTVLGAQIDELVAFPAVLVLIPAFLGTANSLAGVFVSRTTSLLHMGLIRPTARPSKPTVWNIVLICSLAAWSFALIGLASHLVVVLESTASPGLGVMMALSSLSGLLLIPILFTVSYVTAIYTFQRSLDPDDQSIPLVTSVLDLAGSLSIIGVMVLIGLV